MPRYNLTWWFWLATDLILANYLFVDRSFIRGLFTLSLVRLLNSGRTIGLRLGIPGTSSAPLSFVALSR